MPNKSQIVNIKVDQYNKILSSLTEPKTINEISESTGFPKALIQYYMKKLLSNSYQTGLPMVTRYKCEEKRTKKNLPQHAYIRHFSEITLDDLADPVLIEQYRHTLKAKNKLTESGKIFADSGEVKVSHIRNINLLSDPTAQQLKTLQAADEARRDENRKKKHRVNIGGSYSLMGYA